MVRRMTFLLVVLALTVTAYATRIQISEPQCDPSNLGSIVPVYSSFGGFSVVPVDGGGSTTYCNLTGEDWERLVLVIDQSKVPQSDKLVASDVACDRGPFAFCNIFDVPDNTNALVAVFAGTYAPIVLGPPINITIPGAPGIKNLEEFTVDLNCHTPCTDPKPLWPNGLTMVGYAYTNDGPNPTPPIPPAPEPSSLLLVGGGLLGGGLRRCWIR